MQFYFIRHGETDFNREYRLQGNMDTELNEKGRQQAREAAQGMTDLGITCILSSPQKRAKETAEIISEVIGPVPIHLDPDLRERSFGIIEGMSFDEILRRHPKFMEIITNPEGMVVPDSEPIIQVEARVRKVIERLRTVDEKEKVLVVSHGGTGRVFHKVIHQIPDYHKMELGNCQIIDFEL